MATAIRYFRKKLISTSLALSIMLMAGFMNTALAGPFFTEVTEAFPYEPIKTQPSITFQSPMQSQTYNSETVWLNFTITKPDSWFPITNATDENGNAMHLNVVNLTSVGYIVNEQQNTTLSVCDVTQLYEVFPNTQLNFSVYLSLPEGSHTVKVWYKAESFYAQTNYYTLENQTQVWPAGVRNYGNQVLVSHLDGSSNVITFVVSSGSGSFPVTVALIIVGVIVLATMLVTLMVHFRKRSFILPICA